MHSQARELPPKTPQAAHSGPISAHEPLPTQRFFFCGGAPEGHDPPSTHWPLQMIEGASQAHIVGLSDGEGVNPSAHWNPQPEEFALSQEGVLYSG
jgi:hypothetical protein